VSSTAGPDSVRRLAAIAGMLGSEHEGERANAARLATLELRRLGLTWAQVVERAFSYRPAQPEWEQPRASQAQYGRAEAAWSQGRRQYSRGMPYMAEMDGVTVRDIIAVADENRSELNAWECKFVDSFLHSGRQEASPNQWVILQQIAAKLGELMEV
jgi:hypothetical protein